jgi:hypothetical protein
MQSTDVIDGRDSRTGLLAAIAGQNEFLNVIAPMPWPRR